MRVVLIVLDSVGIGALPDAGFYGDEGSDTLGNIAKEIGSLSLPNMAALGLGNLVRGTGGEAVPGVPPLPPAGACGRLGMKSPGKDSTTGHWEMCGVTLDHPFPTYPEGFPPRVLDPIERAIGRRVLGNKAASGTEIIRELGEEHIRTGRPIVYTSADSVFQIACHEDVVPLEVLYGWCLTAREILTGEDMVSRVIARPFTGLPGGFVRTANRKDFSVKPPRPTLLDYCQEAGVPVTAIGKIEDIFAGQGITKSIHTSGNEEVVEAIAGEIQGSRGCKGRRGEMGLEEGDEAGDEAGRHRGEALVFANLVDFDMLYGHRNDVEGFARALEEFDRALPRITGAMGDRDVLVITADHGCDPTTPSTDHSREYVPMLIYGRAVRPGLILRDRESLADLGATVAEVLGVPYRGRGVSFAPEVLVAEPA
jgi:phosphopentomutase